MQQKKEKSLKDEHAIAVLVHHIKVLHNNTHLVLGLHDGFLLSADLLDTVLLFLALLARALVCGLVGRKLLKH